MFGSPLRRGLVALSLLAGTLIAVIGPAQGSTYTGDGFDACTAPSTATMAAWLSSPFRSLGIYIGGANRACGDGNLSASWVATVEGEGWRLAPLYVGLQAPCVGGLATIDPNQAPAQGAAAADDAADRAGFFGLVPGNPIYFDMEAYNGTDQNCTAAVQAFLSAWVGELHNRGYAAGAYGSSASTIHNEAASPYPNPLDDIWFANWNGSPNIYGDPYFPDTMWANNQRLHQYRGGHNETWGGVTINIDSDYDDGAVAGPPQAVPPDCSTQPQIARTGAPSSPSPLTPSVATGWSDWTAVAPEAPPPGGRAAPAVTSWAPGRLDTFVRGTDLNLWHRWSGDGGATFSAWESLGAPPGGLTCSPAAVAWAPNRVDVLGRGSDGALWHTYWDGSAWHPWETLGGILVSSPAVSSWGPGRLDITVAGSDHAIWHTWFDAGWHGWETMGGYGVLDPGMVSWGRSRIDLFTLGVSSTLWHKSWNGARWSGWSGEVPGSWASGPAVASWAPGRLDVFLESQGGPLGHAFFDGSWHAEGLGGNLLGAPAAVSWGFGRIDVFVPGTDGGIWHRSWG